VANMVKLMMEETRFEINFLLILGGGGMYFKIYYLSNYFFFLQRNNREVKLDLVSQLNWFEFF
jgi:hypothetical protein